MCIYESFSAISCHTCINPLNFMFYNVDITIDSHAIISEPMLFQ